MKKILLYILLLKFLVIIANTYSYTLLQDSPKSNKSESQEKLDPKTANEIKRAANQIYRQAQKLFQEGAYWSCARELIILMDFYPTFEKMDGVIYYLAECLYEEELNDAAIKMHKYLIKKYANSEFIPLSMYGLEKASYKEGNYKETLTIYYAIIKRSENQPIIDAARYYAGQSHYYLKNYDTAITIFKKISNTSEYYDGALYTTALIYLKKKSIPTAIDYLRKVVTLPIINGERRRIVDEARITLGYIYYELGMFGDAVKLFADVSERHENFQDALLALGWAYLKLENYQATIKPLLKLIELFPESANAEESYFLLGQSYIMLNDYQKSIEAYKTIVDLFPNTMESVALVKKVSNSLDVEQSKIEQLKVQILIQESNLLTSLPLESASENSPQYLMKEREKLISFRENLIKSLMNERDNLIFMKNQIDKLKKVAERKEKRKDWRGYAEYGISRALFLKEMEQKKAN